MKTSKTFSLKLTLCFVVLTTAQGAMAQALGGTSPNASQKTDFDYHYRFDAKPDPNSKSATVAVDEALKDQKKLQETKVPSEQVSEVKQIIVRGQSTTLGDPYHRTFRSGISF